MKAPRWQLCNILRLAPDSRLVWQFSRRRDKVALTHEDKGAPASLPPNKLVGKDWRELFSPRLNITWLPPQHTYIHVLHLPAGDPSEFASMVEFQLERISPLPLQQMLWTAESYPHPDPTQQIALVIIAPRPAVEELIGALETKGFATDRLDVPLLREFRSLPAPSLGLQILVDEQPDRWVCLAGWWTDSILRDLSLVQLPRTADAPAALVDRLSQTAWAGEMAGWLHSLPPVTLSATPTHADAFASALRDWSGLNVDVRNRPAPPAVAELAAVQALKPDVAPSLVPPELGGQYREKFIERLWTKGLSTLGLAYLFIVVAYLGALRWQESELEDARASSTTLAKQYTNTLQLKKQLEILDEQVSLKFAALDAWKSAVENLPEKLTLSSLNFQNGRTLKLEGTAPSDSTEAVTAFNGALANLVGRENRLVFTNVDTKRIGGRPGASVSTWEIHAELRR